MVKYTYISHCFLNTAYDTVNNVTWILGIIIVGKGQTIQYIDSLSLSFYTVWHFLARHKIEPLSRERVVTFSEIKGDEKRRNEVTPDWERLSHLALFVSLLVCIRNASKFLGTSTRERESRTPLLLLFTYVDVGRWRAAHLANESESTRASYRITTIHSD